MANKETEFNSYIDSAAEPATELEGDVKIADGATDSGVDTGDTKKLEVKIDDVPTSSGDKEDGGEGVVSK